MVTRFRQADGKRNGAFTLVEAMVAFTITLMVTVGVIYSYVQANRMAEFSSLSQAAQSYAVQGAEQAKTALWVWNQYPYTNGPGTGDELPATDGSYASITNIDTFDVPQTGAAFYGTNYIYISTNLSAPKLRQIRSDVIWTFAKMGKIYTNTVVTYRAPDE